MKNRFSARQYARAFCAGADGRFAEIVRALESVAACLAASAELRRLVGHPTVATDDKIAVLRRAGNFDRIPELETFLALLIERRRLDLAGEIARELTHLHCTRHGLVEFSVESAAELGDEDRRRLERQVSSAFNSKVAASYSVNPALLGGLLLRFGGSVLDHSLRRALNVFKHELGIS